ncbi:MAG: response regulator [Lutibacter sp.]|uniref:response regulator n=1 Tax=Lutibacter sp. TaxID=1925666 RepID=UPI001799B95C|nr:response regulator [Lutibacter sp.]MBT8317242.1 response regulator [Lutibacter sp.]NNJ58102.1 response regulator [Lutibacter sp.]
MKTILIIEDDIVLRETTAEILELENYKVVTASNGKRGAEQARIMLPDLILCDIMMPEMDGYELLDILSKDEKTKRIPFIFMSAKTEVKDVRKGMDLGADDYLTKPVSEELLLSAISSRLAKFALLKEEIATQETIDEENFINDIENIEDLKNYFCDYGVSKNYKKGEVIYKEGEYSNNVYLIYKGKIKSFKIDEFGKELILNIHKGDDLLGLSAIIDNSHYYESIMAMENIEIIHVSKNTLLKILENNHKLTLEIFQLINENLTEVKEQLLQMAYGSMRRKTAQTILKFANLMGNNPSNSINISRRDLAGVAGIATESLIRTLTDFKKKGILEIEGRNIRILDLDKLESIN